jgi:hypothetical protein
MSNLLRKCPADGFETGLGHAGACRVCSGPLQLYCKLHNQWLSGTECPTCSPPATAAVAATAVSPTAAPTAAQVPLKSADSGPVKVFVMMVAVFLFGAGLLVFLALKLTSRDDAPSGPRAVAEPVADESLPPLPPAPPPPPPAPAAPPPPAPTPPAAPTPRAVALTISEIMADIDHHAGKRVQVSGVILVVEPDEESFELRQGDFTMPVSYRGLPRHIQSAITAAGADQTLTVTGLLQVDEEFNAPYIRAEQIRFD